MSWRDAVRPVRMQRIGVVVPAEHTRELLARLSSAGVVDLDAVQPEVELAVAAERQPDWSAREMEFRRRTAQAVAHGPVTAWLGWTPSAALPGLTAELAAIGGAAVPLPPPPGIQPPTLLRQTGRGQSFELLVQTYTTVPYADVDPSVVAGIAYVVMFGMMFGDVGHGLLLLIGAAIVRSGRFARLAKIRRAWPFLAGAGAASVVFGFLYGEMFGPSGLVPVLWLAPIDDVITLLLVAIGVGAVLLAGAYALGIVNRFREGGWGFALYARTGIAGSLLFLALGGVVAGLYVGSGGVLLAAVVVAIAGLVLTFVGLLVVAGGGAAGVLQAAVELFDVVIRLGSNVVSFARLAAFGLTHAALGAIVWGATAALWVDGSLPGRLGAVLVLLIGTTVAFALEALVAGIQALRLEYYELFSRVFESDGRPFRPWRLPLEDVEVTP
jgi:V/A-type H+-transporting ATPase subunit I